tara:strand:+ start:324 stop:1109 length:786 start_codon:yes stop_codon:yes gene_type:complete
MYLNSIKGKKILLVGSIGILGKIFAEEIVRHGGDLIIADMNIQKLEKLAKKLSVKYFYIDLEKEKTVIDCVKKSAKYLGGIDVVISNAAITGDIIKKIAPKKAYAPFSDQSLKLWKKTIDVNLTGSFLLARESEQHLSKAKGSFIITSSIYGIVGPDQRIYKETKMGCRASYSASKAGLVGLTKWLATYWGERGIRVNCVVPGGIKSNQDPEFIQNYSNRVPLGRMANPSDIVGIFLYLISDHSAYTTGGVHVVDGGLSVW